MPLNLAVAVAELARLPAAGARRRRPPGPPRLALGALGVFVGNCISVWYLVVLDAKPPVSLGRLLLPHRPRPHARRRCSASRSAAASGSSAGSSVLDAAMVLVGGARGDLVLRHPADRRGRTATAASSLTLLAFAYPARRACWSCSASPRCCCAARSTATGSRSAASWAASLVSIVADLDLRPGARSRPASAARAWTDARVPALLPAAHRQRRAVLAAAGAARLDRGADQEPRPQPLSPLPYLRGRPPYVLLLVPRRSARGPTRSAGSSWARAHDLPHGGPAARGGAAERPPARRDRRRGRTRRGSARWCRTRPT